MPEPAHEAAGSARIVRVLEIDPDLGADLDSHLLAGATRELVAPVVDVEWSARTGRWGFQDDAVRAGLMIVEGLLIRHVRMLGTTSAELLGAGDLLRPAEVDGAIAIPAPAEIEWTALVPVRVAALDEAFLAAACRYPAVLGRLLERAVSRAKALALHDVVTNLKHVETRLLVQFWHLAERWGRVTREGIVIDLPLTHELLAKLVGAARPSVTTALGGLADRGLVARDGRAWVLSHESLHSLEPGRSGATPGFVP